MPNFLCRDEIYMMAVVSWIFNSQSKFQGFDNFFVQHVLVSAWALIHMFTFQHESASLSCR